MGVFIIGLSAFAMLFIDTDSLDKTPNKLETLDQICQTNKRIIGFIFATLQGFFYGLAYSPIRYLVNNNPKASKNMGDYTFPLSIGFFISALLVFAIYSIALKRSLKICRKSDIPFVLSGILKYMIFFR